MAIPARAGAPASWTPRRPRSPFPYTSGSSPCCASGAAGKAPGGGREGAGAGVLGAGTAVGVGGEGGVGKAGPGGGGGGDVAAVGGANAQGDVGRGCGAGGPREHAIDITDVTFRT